ncbi:hypothetical protein Tsubulata_009812 [Turnera subulata]|uniref:F-box domain-containing protein n=1 Tax=Turnera subulata TaxID=218843 RepID=A0A9Q0G8B2_9ROSI|nr:hypothetical protein Tsubulata_009812 [Turnera subulata]
MGPGPKSTPHGNRRPSLFPFTIVVADEVERPPATTTSSRKKQGIVQAVALNPRNRPVGNGMMKEKKQDMRESMKMTEYLPPDLIELILSRLPTKSLHRFLCVCKSWRRLIRSLTRKGINHSQKLFISSAADHYSILDCSTMVMDKHEFPSPQKPSNTLHRPTVSSSPSDGWLILDNDMVKWLLNPSTNEHRECPYIWGAYYFCPHWVYYDSCTDDYKLVGVLTKIHGEHALFGVFSLKQNCWSRVIQFPSAEKIGFHNLAILNGNPHWLSGDDWSKHDDEDWVLFCGSSLHKNRSLIFRFDLEWETQTLIQVPQSRGKYFCDTASLAVISGQLCAFCTCDSKFSLWEMKEYMVMDSWTKVCTITAPGSYLVKPLAFSEDDEVIIFSEKDQEIVAYDPEDRTCRSLVKFEERLGLEMGNKIINYRDV